MLCLAGDAAADQPITVEFEGPWTFIRIKNNPDNCGKQTGGKLSDCIVAISPSLDHKAAVFNGGNNTQTELDPGVYFLELQTPKPDGIGNGNQAARFVDLTGQKVSSDTYTQLITPKSGLDRYVVILPDAPLDPDPLKTSFEEPPKMGGMEYSEEAIITDNFVDPFDDNTKGNKKKYTKGVRIHYTVTDLKAALTGTTNDGTAFTSDPEKASVTFTVDPAPGAFMGCDLHPRQAFADMNDLFHPYPNSKPRKYVDFPDYTGFCRLMDTQQFYSAVFLDKVLPRAGSKKDINLSAVMEFIDNLQKVNLAPPTKDARDQEEIDALLKKVRTYLQGQATDGDKGKGLVNQLNQTLKAFGNFADSNRTKKEKEMMRGIGILQQIITILNTGSGANCKAPMMNAAVQ